MEIKRLEEEDYPDWEEYIKKHPDASFFHQLGWKKVIEKTFGYKSIYLIAKEDNKIKGILPLFLVKQINGKKLLSLPFSTEGGVIVDSENIAVELIEKAKKIVKEEDLDYLELRQGKDLKSDLSTKDYYYDLKLKLDKNSEIIWKNMDRKNRNAIRKAEKLNITTDKGLKYFEDFYKIFSVNMRDLGTPVDKKNFYENIIDEFKNNIEIVVAKLNNKVIASIFLLKFKNIIKSEWASSYRKCFGYNPNQATYWRAIKDACNGFGIFDFGRSMENEGTFFFKKKWGARPIQLHYKYFINKGKMPDIAKTNSKRKIFAKCWSKMPLFLANRIGPWFREKYP